MKETGLYCGIESILVGLALVLKPSQDPKRQSNEISVRLLSILTAYGFQIVKLCCIPGACQYSSQWDFTALQYFLVQIHAL